MINFGKAAGSRCEPDHVRPCEPGVLPFIHRTGKIHQSSLIIFVL